LRANKLGCQIFIHFNLTDTELLLLENLLRVGFHKDSKEKGDITTTAVINVIDGAVARSILNSCYWRLFEQLSSLMQLLCGGILNSCGWRPISSSQS
jgi:hypothetical protein